MENFTKTQLRNSYEISRVIRNVDHSSLTREAYLRPVSWLSRFTTEKEYFKQVHIIKGKAYLMLMSTRTDKKGMYITGSLEYSLDNLPNFIKRHIDFNLFEKLKSTSEYLVWGIYFRDGKIIK